MYPAALPQRPAWIRGAYVAVVLALLALWLLPLAGITLASLRSADELNRGDWWGWPRDTHLVENYRAVLAGSPLLRLTLNSLLVTVPAVVATPEPDTVPSRNEATVTVRAAPVGFRPVSANARST